LKIVSKSVMTGSRNGKSLKLSSFDLFKKWQSLFMLSNSSYIIPRTVYENKDLKTIFKGYPKMKILSLL